MSMSSSPKSSPSNKSEEATMVGKDGWIMSTVDQSVGNAMTNANSLKCWCDWKHYYDLRFKYRNPCEESENDIKRKQSRKWETTFKYKQIKGFVVGGKDRRVKRGFEASHQTRIQFRARFVDDPNIKIPEMDMKGSQQRIHHSKGLEVSPSVTARI